MVRNVYSAGNLANIDIWSDMWLQEFAEFASENSKHKYVELISGFSYTASPFLVIRKIEFSAYELKVPKMWKNLYPVINESKLRPYIGQPSPNNKRPL